MKDKENVRADRHLLPIDTKLLNIKDEEKLPFHTVDLIFNHKNVWANLQNPNPARIMYDIHDNTKWLPLVYEPYSAGKHPMLKS